jgi:hypothetical protein
MKPGPVRAILPALSFEEAGDYTPSGVFSIPDIAEYRFRSGT